MKAVLLSHLQTVAPDLARAVTLERSQTGSALEAPITLDEVQRAKLGADMPDSARLWQTRLITALSKTGQPSLVSSAASGTAAQATLAATARGAMLLQSTALDRGKAWSAGATCVAEIPTGATVQQLVPLAGGQVLCRHARGVTVWNQDGSSGSGIRPAFPKGCEVLPTQEVLIDAKNTLQTWRFVDESGALEWVPKSLELPSPPMEWVRCTDGTILMQDWEKNVSLVDEHSIVVGWLRAPGDSGTLLLFNNGCFGQSDSNHSLHVFDPRTRETRLSLVGHQGYVRCATTAPGGGFVTGSDDHSVKLWNEAGECMATLPHEDAVVVRMAWLADDLLATAAWGTTGAVVRVWRRDGTLLSSLTGHTEGILTLAALPDGRLASGGYDGVIRIWAPGSSGNAKPHENY